MAAAPWVLDHVWAGAATPTHAAVPRAQRRVLAGAYLSHSTQRSIRVSAPDRARWVVAGLLRAVRGTGWAVSEDDTLQAAWVRRAVLEVWRAAVAARDASVIPDVLAAAHAAYADAAPLDVAQAAWSYEVCAHTDTGERAHRD